MTAFTASSYLSNAGRTEAEMKQAFEDNLAATKQLPGGSARTTLTLASDQITPTGPVHLVDTQGGAGTDDLAQILQTNLGDGSWLMLSIVNNSRVVVVKHAAGGTGQISLVNAADFTLSNTTMFLLLQRNGTVWEERDRFYGTNTAAHRAFYGTPGFGQNTFTGRQEWKMGASIASAATLTLGTDGNSFHVTGGTTITAISAAPAGTPIRLIFDGAPQITHNATSLILPGGLNIQTIAGTILEFISEGSGNWRLANGNVSGNGVTVLDRNPTLQAVANTGVETTIWNFNVKANTLGTTKRLRLQLQLLISDNAALGGASTGIIFRVYYGSSGYGNLLYYTSVSDGVNGAVIGATGWGVILDLLFSANGATNSQYANFATNGPIKGTAVTTGGSAPAEVVGGSAGVGAPAGYGNAAEDSTVDKILAVTAQWVNPDAARGLHMRQAVLELV